jgi:hypothetical protein
MIKRLRSLAATLRCMMRATSLSGGLAAVALAACGHSGAAANAKDVTSVGCLPGDRGFLQASLRGAMQAELDWRGAMIECEGGARPDGSGIRLSVGGKAPDGQALRLVFGIAVHPGESASRPLPTNLTVIVENQSRVFSTLGDNRCTVESLVQQPLPATGESAGKPGSKIPGYRIAARGFCVAPATTLDGTERLYVDRFDIAALARFTDEDLKHAP